MKLNNKDREKRNPAPPLSLLIIRLWLVFLIIKLSLFLLRPLFHISFLANYLKKNPDDKVLILKVKVFLRNILILLIEQIWRLAAFGRSIYGGQIEEARLLMFAWLSVIPWGHPSTPQPTSDLPSPSETLPFFNAFIASCFFIWKGAYPPAPLQ